jgi:LuxR family quorum-sensing system transcriptional regulator SolR
MLALPDLDTPPPLFPACPPFEIACAVATDMGFDDCAYYVQMPLPIFRPATAICRSGPGGRSRETLRTPCLGVDPSVRRGLRDMCAFEWRVDGAGPARLPWSDGARHGITHGWAYALTDSRGAIGLLRLGRHANAEAIRASEGTQMQIAWLAQQCHAHMAEQLFRQHLPEAGAEMTSREREILSWSAEGKTAYEIGRILGVTEATIIFHLNKAMRKLGAVNKAQAIAKALRFGMLP